MSDLQLSLIALGALIILAVIIFNWWQEHSYRKQVAERFDEPSHDPLIDDFSINTEKVLADELYTPIVKSSPEPVDEFAISVQEPRHDADDFVSPAVADAVSALAEFEQDMATSEYEPNAPSYQEPADLQASEIAQADLPATPSELMEEAGLDNSTKQEFEEKSVDETLHIEADSLPATMTQQIDLIAVLFMTTPTTGAALREFLLSIADLDKPIYAYGLGDDGVWRMLTREQESAEFKRAACSLQLVDRGGQVSKHTLNRFQEAVDSIGHKLGAQIEWLGNPNPAAYANELDQFCIDVDKLVGFHLVQGASGPFTGTKFRGLAEAGGLALEEDGVFYYVSEHGQKLFSLHNQDANPFSVEMLRTAVIRGVKFQLDIPRVKNCAEAFNQMVLLARQMEGSLSARLVDDNQKQLDEAQIEKIRQQLKVIHAKMVARGIIPGSPCALRLFS